MDECDKSLKLENQIRDAEIAYRKPVPRTLPKTGWCWNNCGTETGDLFCCDECKHDYNLRKGMEAQNKR